MGVAEQEPIRMAKPPEPRVDLQQMQFENPRIITDSRDESIQNMRETIEILELKVKKLEHMLKIKENKIENLTKRLADAGLY